MEIDAWDHKGKHYSGQGKNLIAALKDARKQAMIEHGITWLDVLAMGESRPYPIRAYQECTPGAELVEYGEWRMDERRNM